MEATGEIIATVNEMLLQSYDGVIDVFATIPKSIIDKEQVLGLHKHNAQNKTLHYGSWENCSFSKMLAKEESIEELIKTKIRLGFQMITADNVFSVYEGYGFKQKEKLIARNRNIVDQIRTDFIEGTEEATFLMEVTKGRYDLLVICGDEKEPSYTEVTIDRCLKVQSKTMLKAGEYLYEVVPLMIKEDKYLEVQLNTKVGEMWKLNSLIVNKVHSL